MLRQVLVVIFIFSVGPALRLHEPEINGYWALTSVGRAYAVLHAVDGDGAVNRAVYERPGGAVGIADRVDAGGGSAEDLALRHKALTFHVMHAAVLLPEQPAFFPTPGAPGAGDERWVAGGSTCFFRDCLGPRPRDPGKSGSRGRQITAGLRLAQPEGRC